MADKHEPLKRFLIDSVEASAIRIFDLEARKRGFRDRRPFFYYLMHAAATETLFVMEKPVKEVLVGAAKAEMLLEARMAARKEVKNVLWEEGFILDPAEPSEILERAKP